MPHILKSLALGLTTLLLLAAAIAEIVLAAKVHQRLNYAFAQQKADNDYPPTDVLSVIPYIPIDVYGSSIPYFGYTYSSGEVAVGVLNLISVLAIATVPLRFRGKDRRPGGDPLSRHWLCVALFLGAVVLTTAGILGWVFADWDRATVPDFGLAPIASDDSTPYWQWTGYTDSTTWEKYTCRAGALVGSWFVPTCHDQRAARWTLIPLFVLSVLATVLFLARYPLVIEPGSASKTTGKQVDVEMR